MPIAANFGFDETTGERATAVRSEDGVEGYAVAPIQGATRWNGDDRNHGFDLAPLPRMFLELIQELEAAGWNFSKPGRMSESCRQHDMVLLGADGKLLIPALSWQCNAAEAEAKALNADSAVTNVVGRVEPRLVLPKLMYVLKVEPSLRDKIKWVMTTGDWIAFMLTGKMSLNTSEAQSNGLFDKASGQRLLAADVLRHVGLKPEWFPPIVESGKPVGAVTQGDAPGDTQDWKELRKKLAGWEVVAGMGDNHASAVGCGVKDSASVLVSAGTSGTINWVSSGSPPAGSGIMCFGFFLQNLWLLMLGRCASWYNAALEEFAHPHEDDHELLNRLAMQSNIGAIRRVEYFDGEVYRPGWTGLSLKAKVASVQCSIMAELLLRLQAMINAMPPGTAVKRFILTGGLSQSEFFRHVFQVGVRRLVPDAEVLVSGRTGPLRYKTTAYGALVNAEFHGNVGAIPSDRFPLVSCAAPDDVRRQQIESLLSSWFKQQEEKLAANNRIVHFEIPANQPEPLTKFYADLFGWKFQRAPMPGPEYWLCETGDGPGINGAVMQRQHPQQPWMNYVDVASIDAAITQATSLGAKVALPKTSVPGVGAYAAIIDPQGNICGLWEQSGK